jgi:CCR4-NOT transcription complex subunit 7/8
LTCTPLPAEEAAFFELLHTYFPCIYDEKHMMRDCGDGIKGGLNYLADQIQVRRL